MKAQLLSATILIILLLLSSARFFSRPEDQILNSSLQVVLKVAELPIVSGIAKQNTNKQPLYQTSGILVKKGLNLSYPVYYELQRTQNPQQYIAQKSREIALGMTEKWEQQFNDDELIAAYGKKIERPVLLNRLRTGTGSALDYSKLITIPKQSFPQLELQSRTVAVTGQQEKIKIICRQDLPQITDKIYQAAGHKILNFSILLSPDIQEKDIALFIENIPAQNTSSLAAVLLENTSNKANVSTPRYFTSGKIEQIAYKVPEGTFLTEVQIADNSGKVIYSAQEILPDIDNAVPFFWDATSQGQKVSDGEYKLTVRHLGNNKRVLEKYSSIVLINHGLNVKKSKAYYTISRNDSSPGSRKFAISLSDERSGAFKLELKIIDLQDRSSYLLQEQIFFTLSNPSHKHSSFYFSGQDRNDQRIKLVVNLKDHNNQPIPSAYVKILGDQGFDSGWLRTNNRGLLFQDYYLQSNNPEHLSAFMDLVQINENPISTKQIK